MQHHLYRSVLPVVGGEDKVLESVKNILRPYVKDIVNRIKFELTSSYAINRPHGQKVPSGMFSRFSALARS